jgi:hypothetical protein
MYAGAMNLAQGAWMNECMGNALGAGPLYQQACQGLTACAQMMGPRTPDVVFYGLGCCQVRLAWLNAAHPGGARYWLEQALPNLQAAWQRNPAQPAYQMAADQVAVVLNQLGAPVPAPQQASPSPQPANPQPAAPQGPWHNLNKGMDTVKKGLEIVKGLMNLFGGSGGGSPNAGGYGGMFGGGGGGYPTMW